MESIVGNRSCLLQLEPVDLNSLEFILPTLTLATLNVVVIFGNLLVVAAVFTTRKLRTVTNTFIVSLAVADLFVGVLVLPFSNANEVLRYWVFGPIWCSVWLAVDVWLCTASILNLCAISLDRYLAISKPFKYHDLMTPRRGKLLVAFVWVISFVICFPPLIGWNEQGANLGERFKKGDPRHPDYVPPGNDTQIFVLDFRGLFNNFTYHVYNYSTFEAEATSLPPCEIYYPECGLTSDPGYIVYSAMGSFYIPMLVMAFFYWRIYRTAVRTTNALKKGMLTMKTSGEMTSLHDDTSVTLRVHRGGGASTYNATSNCNPHSGPRRETSLRENATQNGDRLSASHLQAKRAYIRETSIQRDGSSRVRLKDNELTACDCPLLSEDQEQPSSNKQKKKSSNCKTNHQEKKTSETEEFEDKPQEYKGDGKNVTVLRKFGRKNFKMHLRKLNKEKKAAKTVGIIVGCFIVCWFPFFTVYFVGAFCETCTPPLLFSVFFWLGYCNSAVNPCIYALFSKDFRYAFKRLLACKCQCEQPTLADRKRRTGLWSVIYGIRFHTSSSKGSDSNSE